MSDDKKSDFDKAQDAAQLALVALPVFTQLLAAFGDFINKIKSAKKDDA